MQFDELSYASPHDPAIKRWLIHVIEHLSGRPLLLPVYRDWQVVARSRPNFMMRELIRMVDVRLTVRGPAWPPQLVAGEPTIMIANHPFGIGDGVALLALAEELGRPYRVFVDSRLMKIPEIRPFALPICFEATREARRINLRSRQKAREFLVGEHTVVVFPAGAVATARWPFGRAKEWPWKNFTARLLQGSGASVLPFYFEGQNSPIFHVASRLSMTLRLALLVSEFIRRFRGAEIIVHSGLVVPNVALSDIDNGKRLTKELYRMVMELAPGSNSRSHFGDTDHQNIS
ncbi:MAG: glycerol acyltransferase [Hyphomicrobiaceae bacterium]